MFFSPRAKHTELTGLFRRLGTGLKAGLEIRRLCEREAESGRGALRRRMAVVRDAVNRGDSLADGLRGCGPFFPPLVCDMVEVGEHTGRLDEVAFRLAEHYDHLVKLRRSFLLGIIWPVIQLMAAVFIVGFLIWIMGYIGSLTGSKPIDMLGVGLVGTRGLVIYIAIVSGVALVGFVAITAAARSPLLLRLSLRVPVLGRCLENMALARLCWSLGMAHEAGMDARKTVATALRATNHPPYSAKSDVIDRVILAGGELHEGFRQTGVYPPDFLDSLENAEHAGRISEALIHHSAEYQQKANAASMVLTAMATVGIWVIVAGVLIAIIFRLALFYIGMIYDALNMTV